MYNKFDHNEEILKTFDSGNYQSIIGYSRCVSRQDFGGKLVRFPRNELLVYKRKDGKMSLVHCYGVRPTYNTFYFDDYGRTWAFTKRGIKKYKKSVDK